jgi:hypothetical protein
MADDCGFRPSLVVSGRLFSEVGRDGMLHGGLKGGTRRVALSSRAIEILNSLKPKDETSPWFGITARMVVYQNHR